MKHPNVTSACSAILRFIRSDNLLAFIGRVFIYTSIGLLIFVATHEILKKWVATKDVLQDLSATSALVGVIGFTWVFRTKVEGRNWSATGLGVGQFKAKDFFAGLLVGCGSFLLVTMELVFTGKFQLVQQQLEGVGLRALLFSLVFNFCQPAVEEVLFRGYLCTAFAERFNVVFSCIAVGLIFGFLHQDSPGFGPVMLLNAVAMTACMYVARLATGSLLWPIGWHMGWNFLQEYSSEHNMFLANTYPEATLVLSAVLVATISIFASTIRGGIPMFSKLPWSPA